MDRRYKRKKLWVDGLQGRLMVRMSMYLVLYAVIVFHVSFFMQIISQMVQHGLRRGLPDLYVEFLSQHLYLFYSLLIVLPCIAIDMLKCSNRIAGPLYRCRRVMQEMAAGRGVPPFQPRRHDLMREFWEAFNAMIAAWNVRVSTRATPANGRTVEPAGGPVLH